MKLHTPNCASSVIIIVYHLQHCSVNQSKSSPVYGGIVGASSSLFVALHFCTAVYSSSTVCGGINGDASVSSVAGLSFGFFITAKYKSKI